MNGGVWGRASTDLTTEIAALTDGFLGAIADWNLRVAILG